MRVCMCVRVRVWVRLCMYEQLVVAALQLAGESALDRVDRSAHIVGFNSALTEQQRLSLRTSQRARTPPRVRRQGGGAAEKVGKLGR